MYPWSSVIIIRHIRQIFSRILCFSVSSLVRQDTLVMVLMYVFDQMLKCSLQGGWILTQSLLLLFCFVDMNHHYATQYRGRSQSRYRDPWLEWDAVSDWNLLHPSEKAPGRSRRLSEEMILSLCHKPSVWSVEIFFPTFPSSFDKGGEEMFFFPGKSSPRTSKSVHLSIIWDWGYWGPEALVVQIIIKNPSGKLKQHSHGQNLNHVKLIWRVNRYFRGKKKSGNIKTHEIKFAWF